MASGIESGGVDLDNIYAAFVTGMSRVSATAIEVSGLDISYRYAPLSYGAAAPNCGIRSGGTDLSAIFAQIGTAYLLNALLFSGGTTNNVASGGVKTSNIYKPSNDAVSITTNLVVAVAYTAGAGNVTQGTNGGGSNAANTSTVGISIYTYSSTAWSTPSSGNAVMYEYMGASADSTYSHYFCGLTITNVIEAVGWRYTFSSGAQVVTTSNAVALSYTAGFGDGTYGYYTGGNTSSTNNLTTYRYTYSSQAYATRANLNTVRVAPGCAGNTVYGIWVGGQNASGTELTSSSRFTISSDIWASVGSLGTAKSFIAGAPTNTAGYYSGGNIGGSSVTASTDILTYSSGTRAGGVSLSQARSTIAGSGWGAY